jgi:hypothetical protein
VSEPGRGVAGRGVHLGEVWLTKKESNGKNFLGIRSAGSYIPKRINDTQCSAMECKQAQ